MPGISRVAIGSYRTGTDPQPLTWALLSWLSQRGEQTQPFHSCACFVAHEAAQPTCGRPARHLDSWLMGPDVCRELFAHACSAVTFAVVHGRWGGACGGSATCGGLERLSDWLDLPRLAIVDLNELDGCHVPPRPEADGLLLDGVADVADFYRQQTILESLWGIPVVGALERCEKLRRAIRQLPCGAGPCEELCGELGRRFGKFVVESRLRGIASRPGPETSAPRLFRPGPGIARAQVAVAFDEAFHCYFPDTLDLLELRGAVTVDFSPLADAQLPEGTDILYLGCGHPERYAEALAANPLMMSAIRQHICAGRRVYAEGGGLAYLCQQLQTPGGEYSRMVGALPAVASLNPDPPAPRPAELTLSSTSWLGAAGQRLRGYLNEYWRLRPAGPLHEHDTSGELRLVGRHHALGSRVHLNFALLPHAFRGFLRPHAECLDC